MGSYLCLEGCAVDPNVTEYWKQQSVLYQADALHTEVFPPMYVREKQYGYKTGEL